MIHWYRYSDMYKILYGYLAGKMVALIERNSSPIANYFKFVWRDCVGIEPTEDGTRLPHGFEDQGGHQSLSQPHHYNRLMVHGKQKTTGYTIHVSVLV